VAEAVQVLLLLLLLLLLLDRTATLLGIVSTQCLPASVCAKYHAEAYRWGVRCQCLRRGSWKSLSGSIMVSSSSSCSSSSCCCGSSSSSSRSWSCSCCTDWLLAITPPPHPTTTTPNSSSSSYYYYYSYCSSSSYYYYYYYYHHQARTTRASLPCSGARLRATSTNASARTTGQTSFYHQSTTTSSP
jgi:hypothetical protein